MKGLGWGFEGWNLVRVRVSIWRDLARALQPTEEGCDLPLISPIPPHISLCLARALQPAEEGRDGE